MENVITKKDVLSLIKESELFLYEILGKEQISVLNKKEIADTLDDMIKLIKNLIKVNTKIKQYKVTVINHNSKDTHESYVLANTLEEAKIIATNYYDDFFYNESTGELDMYSCRAEEISFKTIVKNVPPELKAGMVIETMDYHLITREDSDFIYARQVKPYLTLGLEFILFTKTNLKKEWNTLEPKIIDMNEVTQRFLNFA